MLARGGGLASTLKGGLIYGGVINPLVKTREEE